MERTILLLAGAGALGFLFWILWPGMSSPDTWLILVSALIGLAAGVFAFLALAKVLSFNKWTATAFWVLMLSALAYTFPPLGWSSYGWIAWGGIVFLSVASLAVVVLEPEGEPRAQGRRRRRRQATYRPMGENGWDEGMNHSGYPTQKALRMGTYKSSNDL